MKNISRKKSPNKLFQENDPPETTEAVNAILEVGYYVERQKNSHHLKVRKANYYPTTGTITVDGDGKAKPEKGLEHFIWLLREMYPKKPRANLLGEPAPLSLTDAIDDALPNDSGLSGCIGIGEEPEQQPRGLDLSGAIQCEDKPEEGSIVDLEQERAYRLHYRQRFS